MTILKQEPAAESHSFLSPSSSPGKGRERAWLTIATLGLLLPFLSKPFHIDDPVYLRVAHQIMLRPLAPYDFDFNWFGTSLPMWDIMLNPPGLSYLMVPLISVVGEHEIPLHTAFLVFPVLAVQATYAIARRFSDIPFWIALLVLVAPMFAVSATTLMADVPALALGLCSVALLFASLEGRRGASVLSGVFAAGALLIKYNSVFLLALLALAMLLFDRKPWRHVAALMIPFLSLCAWEGLNYRTHGAVHLLRATASVQEQRPDTPQMILAAAAFLFLGIASLPVLLLARWRDRVVGIAAAMALPSSVWLVIRYGTQHSRLAGWSDLSVITGLAAAGGLAGMVLAVREGVGKTFDRRRLFLLLWFLGTLLQAVFFSYFVAERFLLPVLVPMILLCTRSVGSRAVRIAVVTSMMFSLAAMLADSKLARTYRDAAVSLDQRYENLGSRLRFQGHWGFQYYLERKGHLPFDYRRPDLAPGVVLASPRWAGPVRYRFGSGRLSSDLIVEPVSVMKRKGSWPVTIMNPETGAGFYNSNWGVLPFSRGSDTIETITVVQLKRPPRQ